jgi:hypothetical protein
MPPCGGLDPSPPQCPGGFQPAYQLLVKREAEVEAMMLSLVVGRYHCVAYCQTLAMWACPEISESLKPYNVGLSIRRPHHRNVRSLRSPALVVRSDSTGSSLSQKWQGWRASRHHCQLHSCCIVSRVFHSLCGVERWAAS